MLSCWPTLALELTLRADSFNLDTHFDTSDMETDGRRHISLKMRWSKFAAISVKIYWSIKLVCLIVVAQVHGHQI